MLHMENKRVKATKDGKLYITTEDFFNSPKIKEQIPKLVEFANNNIKK